MKKMKTKAKMKTDTNHNFHVVQRVKMKKLREIIAGFEHFFIICTFTG